MKLLTAVGFLASLVCVQASAADAVPGDLIESQIHQHGLPTEFGIVISWVQLRDSFVKVGLTDEVALIDGVLNLNSIVLHRNQRGAWWIALDGTGCQSSFIYRLCREFNGESICTRFSQCEAG